MSLIMSSVMTFRLKRLSALSRLSPALICTSANRTPRFLNRRRRLRVAASERYDLKLFRSRLIRSAARVAALVSRIRARPRRSYTNPDNTAGRVCSGDRADCGTDIGDENCATQNSSRKRCRARLRKQQYLVVAQEPNSRRRPCFEKRFNNGGPVRAKESPMRRGATREWASKRSKEKLS
jgi:hypothetical protein